MDVEIKFVGEKNDFGGFLEKFVSCADIFVEFADGEF